MELQQQVYVVVVVLAFLTIIIGAFSVVYGENLEISIVGTIINFSITGILVYGVKRQDTTHVMVWLVSSIVEMVLLVIGMSYYAIKADHIQNIYKYISENDSFQRKELLENISGRKLSCIVLSIIFGASTVILFCAILIVKMLYHQLQRREGYQSQMRRV